MGRAHPEVSVHPMHATCKLHPLIGETNFLGRDQEIRLMKIHYKTETEKKWILIF